MTARQATAPKTPADNSIGLDRLCEHVGYATFRILRAVDDVDLFDTDAVEAAIRPTLDDSLISYAGLFAAEIAAELDQAIIDGRPLPGALIRTEQHGAGTLILAYRNNGVLGGWLYRVRFAEGNIAAVWEDQAEWVGGIQQARAA